MYKTYKSIKKYKQFIFIQIVSDLHTHIFTTFQIFSKVSRHVLNLAKLFRMFQSFSKVLKNVQTFSESVKNMSEKLKMSPNPSKTKCLEGSLFVGRPTKKFPTNKKTLIKSLYNII